MTGFGAELLLLLSSLCFHCGTQTAHVLVLGRRLSVECFLRKEKNDRSAILGRNDMGLQDPRDLRTSFREKYCQNITFRCTALDFLCYFFVCELFKFFNF